MALLPELSAYIAANISGGGFTEGTNLFDGKLPADPDVIISIIPYAALPAEPKLGKQAIALEFPRVQVVCRGARDDYATPWANAQLVVQALAKIEGSTLSGTRYLSALPESGPFFLRRDTNDRIEIITNYQVIKEFNAT